MNVALILPGFSAHEDDWAIPALQVYAGRLAVAHGVHVFSLRYPAAGRYHFAGLTLHASGGGQRFGTRSLPIWIRTVAAIVAQHRRTPFDVLHAFWADEPGLVALWAGRLLRRPVIVSAAGGEFAHFPELGYGTAGSKQRRRLVQYVMHFADLVTAGSAYQLALCRAGGAPPARSLVAPLGLDTDHFRPGEKRPAARPPTVIQVASLTPVKNQALLLDVFRRVVADLPEARLLLAGDGPERPALQARAEQLGVAGCITWAGEVPYPQMPAVYQQADLYVQSSVHEAQGMAVLEAAACGVPVIGTPVGVVCELAARPPDTRPEILAEQAISLLRDPAALAREGTRARRQAEAFSVEKTAGRFLALYERPKRYGR